MQPPTPHHRRPNWWRHKLADHGPYHLWEVIPLAPTEPREVQLWHEVAGVVELFTKTSRQSPEQFEAELSRLVLLMARAELIAREPDFQKAVPA